MNLINPFYVFTTKNFTFFFLVYLKLEREANEKLQQRIDTAIHNKNSIDRRANWLEQQTEELRSHIDQLEQQLSTQKDENKWMSETNEKLTADNESLRVCDYTLCLLSVKYLSLEMRIVFCYEPQFNSEKTSGPCNFM